MVSNSCRDRTAGIKQQSLPNSRIGLTFPFQTSFSIFDIAQVRTTRIILTGTVWIPFSTVVGLMVEKEDSQS